MPTPETEPPTAPQVSMDRVVWQIPYAWAPDGVRLEVDWVLTADPEFVRVDDCWTYRLDRPAARRFDYRLILRGSGSNDPVPDPTNPRRLRHPFGDRSVIEFPDYQPPTWLDTVPTGRTETLTLAQGQLEAPVPAQLWSPDGLDVHEPAPLLVAHDGSSLAEAGLLIWASRQVVDTGPLRVALLDPAYGCRDSWYAAGPAYLDHVARVVLPALRARVAVTTVIGLGASLGGLAMLGLQRWHQSSVDALMLQSGTFLTPDLDPQESGYPYFDRVCRAVTDLATAWPARVVPTAMTCGAIEENLANNERMASALTRLGYPVDFTVVPDAHTTIGWRDAWSPGLDALVGGPV